MEGTKFAFLTLCLGRRSTEQIGNPGTYMQSGLHLEPKGALEPKQIAEPKENWRSNAHDTSICLSNVNCCGTVRMIVLSVAYEINSSSTALFSRKNVDHLFIQNPKSASNQNSRDSKQTDHHKPNYLFHLHRLLSTTWYVELIQWRSQQWSTERSVVIEKMKTEVSRWALEDQIRGSEGQRKAVFQEQNRGQQSVPTFQVALLQSMTPTLLCPSWLPKSAECSSQ